MTNRLDITILLNSLVILSVDIFAKESLCLFSSEDVLSSITKRSCAANRMALSILRASSLNLSAAFPTHLIMPRFISPIPSNGSIRPSSSLYAIALIVKSRRLKSSVRSSTNVTLSGLRLSEYTPSIRNEVHSYCSPSMTTVTVPCCNPVSITR